MKKIKATKKLPCGESHINERRNKVRKEIKKLLLKREYTDKEILDIIEKEYNGLNECSISGVKHNRMMLNIKRFYEKNPNEIFELVEVDGENIPYYMANPLSTKPENSIPTYTSKKQINKKRIK